ncbi:MAG: alanine racemase C-terminal domain-containing protein, partial [Flavobacteriales bacterium]
IGATLNASAQLVPVNTFKTVISQVKKIKAGESVGYTGKNKVDRDTEVAVVPVGYADGYPRSLSNGKGKMLVSGRLAPILGNVCMDMVMLDVTGLGAREGDEVIVFGRQLPVQEVALWANTIPYELLAAVSSRVKRVYVQGM